MSDITRDQLAHLRELEQAASEPWQMHGDWGYRQTAYVNALCNAAPALLDAAEHSLGAGLDAFQQMEGTWADETFPTSTPASILAHLRTEVTELSVSLEPEEAADCLLLLLHFAHKRGFSLMQEARRKFAINQTRTWGEPNEEGFVEHIRMATPETANALTEIQVLQSEVAALAVERDALRERAVVMREALEWYADEAVYRGRTLTHHTGREYAALGEIWGDKGERARQALAAGEENG